MGFNCGADLRPLRRVDTDAAIFYRELGGGWIFDKFWYSRRARFPFFAARVGDQFGEMCGDERRRIGFAIALDRRAQQRRNAMQNVHGAIFSVAAQTNHNGNVEIEFPKGLRQTVRGPVLFLARYTRAGTEITNQVRLGQNDSSGTIDLGCSWIATRVSKIGDGEI